MPTHIPSNEPTEIRSIAYIRQNAWKKIAKPLDAVKSSLCIHVPHAHTKQDVDDFRTNSASLTHTHARTVLSIPVGSTVLIPNGRVGLLVKFTSGALAGTIDSLKIVSDPKTCGHTAILKSCAQCLGAIDSVLSSPIESIIQQHIQQGQTVEPFWSVYRTVEIVGDVDYNGVNGRTMAGMDSAGRWEHFWTVQSTV
jgi:hypothetical protein